MAFKSLQFILLNQEYIFIITEEDPKETKGRGEAKGKKENSADEDIPKEEQRGAKGRDKSKGKKVMGKS